MKTEKRQNGAYDHHKSDNINDGVHDTLLEGTIALTAAK